MTGCDGVVHEGSASFSTCVCMECGIILCLPKCFFLVIHISVTTYLSVSVFVFLTWISFCFFQTLFVVICSFVEQVVLCSMIVDQLQKPLSIHPVYVMALTLFCGVSNQPYLDAFNVLTLGIRRGGGGGQCALHA